MGNVPGLNTYHLALHFLPISQPPILSGQLLLEVWMSV